MKRDMRPVRQGDVLLIPVNQIPEGAVEVEPAKGLPPILAYGETTGHAHGLYGRAKMFRDTGAGGGTYIDAGNNAKVSVEMLGAKIERSVAQHLVDEGHGVALAHGTPTDAVTLPRDPDHHAIPLSGLYEVRRQVEFPRAAPARQVAD